MKTKFAFSIALASLICVSAFAQNATPKALEKYNQVVDAQQAKQQERYDKGVANGSLNASEQARLDKRLQVTRLSHEQRQQVKEKLRSRWQAMTPEERAAAKLKLKQRYQSLSPEQKEKLLERWQQRSASAPD